MPDCFPELTILSIDHCIRLRPKWKWNFTASGGSGETVFVNLPILGVGKGFLLSEAKASCEGSRIVTLSRGWNLPTGLSAQQSLLLWGSASQTPNRCSVNGLDLVCLPSVSTKQINEGLAALAVSGFKKGGTTKIDGGQQSEGQFFAYHLPSGSLEKHNQVELDFSESASFFDSAIVVASCETDP